MHGDYIVQLRDGQEKLEERLRLLEDKGMGSTVASSEQGRPNVMIFGGWPQDTLRETLLEELTRCLEKLGLEQAFEDYFCTGPRRGFAIALLAMEPQETGTQLKKRMIAIAQQVQKANISTKTMEQGKSLRASLGKSKHERMIANHTGKTKRLILTAAAHMHQHMDTEYSAGNVWLQARLVASATRPQPNPNCKPGKLDRSWIDIDAISSMVGATAQDLSKQWEDFMLL